MLRIPLALVLSLRALEAAPAPVAPIPESDQAARALRILDTYHGPRPANPPKLLHIVYFTPADREPAAQYTQRLDAIMEDIRGFYRDGMNRSGFGPKTFTLPRDAEGKLIIRLIKGREPEAAFPGWEGRNGGNTGAPEGGDMVKRACQPALETAGIFYDRETLLCAVMVFRQVTIKRKHWFAASPL